MFSQPEMPVVLQQWMDLILDYSFTIRHRAGILNVVPDQLSRMYAASYRKATWGVPPNIRFEGIPAEELAPNSVSIKPLSVSQDQSSRGERSAADTAAEQDSNSDQHLINLQVEMERRGKTIPDAAERVKLIQHEHNLGHFGRDAIFTKLYEEHNIWWPNMRTEIQREVARCDACARFVVRKAGFKPAQFIAAPGPWQHVQFDCSVHLPSSPEGFTTLLVFVDVFSGFVLLFPIETTSAKCVAEKLLQVCTTFGFPAILQSDNGTEFTNDVVRELCELMKLDRRFIAAYNPRCDGKVERAIGIVVIIIKKLLQGADQYWPQFCPLAQLCVNNRISSVTRSTPFALMFARDNPVLGPWQSTDAQLAAPEVNSEAALSAWLEFQKRVQEIIYPEIYKRTLEVKKKMVKRVNKKHRHQQVKDDAFPVGSWVALKDPKYETNDKRQPAYWTKYEVIRHDRNGNIVIREALSDGKVLDRHIPPDQLKPVGPDRTAEPDQDPDEAFVVERILSHRGKPPSIEYKVLWKGYPIEEATWEPASSFLDTKVIRDYWKAENDAKQQ